MAEQEILRIDLFWSGSPKEKLPVREPASRWVNGIKLGRLEMGFTTCCAALLLFSVMTLAAPAVSSAEVSVGISVTFAPPALPVYEQPLCPGPDFIWVPGYWAWDPDYGYYWVPGVWVLAPFPGALWTPGYWGWSDGVYVWYEGYWGPVVGFYGGINYGFGYTGFGYDGGYWRGGAFYYNKTVNNINVTNITNVYSKTVVNVSPTGASFNGGSGGTTARPTAEQLAAAKQRRSAPVDAQMKQLRAAQADPKQRASVNQGKPAIAATQKPGLFTGSNIVPAKRPGAPYKAPSGGTTAPGGPASKEKREVKPQEKKTVVPGGPAPKEERREVKPQERKPVAPGGPALKEERREVKPQERKPVAPERAPAPKEEKKEVKPQEKKPVAPERGPAPKEEKKPAGPAEEKKHEEHER